MIDSIESVLNNNTTEAEMRIRLDALNKIAMERQNESSTPVTPIKKGTLGSHTRDNVSITPEASIIAESGLDMSQSNIRRSGDKLEFHLRFETDKFSAMTTKGSFSPSTKEMSLFVSFNFKDTVQTAEIPQQEREYNVRIKLEASNVSPQTFSKIEGRSPKIEQFIDNLLERMIERVHGKQYPPLSVVLKLDSIADLISETGGLFQKVSRAMMVFNSSLARAIEGHQFNDGALPMPTYTAGSGESEEAIKIKDFSFHMKDVSPTPLGTGQGSTVGMPKQAILPVIGTGVSSPTGTSIKTPGAGSDTSKSLSYSS